MSFSFLGSLGALLPGYMKGEQQAINDNWQDLMNYNRAQQGQLANAFTEATWQNRLDQYDAMTRNYQMDAMGNLLNLGQRWLAAPGDYWRAEDYTYNSPWLSGWNNWAQLQAYRNAYNNQGQLGI